MVIHKWTFILNLNLFFSGWIMLQSNEYRFEVNAWDARSLVSFKVEYYKRVTFLLIMIPIPHDALPCSNHCIVYLLFLRAADFVCSIQRGGRVAFWRTVHLRCRFTMSRPGKPLHQQELRLRGWKWIWQRAFSSSPGATGHSETHMCFSGHCCLLRDALGLLRVSPSHSRVTNGAFPPEGAGRFGPLR